MKRSALSSQLSAVGGLLFALAVLAVIALHVALAIMLLGGPSPVSRPLSSVSRPPSSVPRPLSSVFRFPSSDAGASVGGSRVVGQNPRASLGVAAREVSAPISQLSALNSQLRVAHS